MIVLLPKKGWYFISRKPAGDEPQPPTPPSSGLFLAAQNGRRLMAQNGKRLAAQKHK